MAGAAAKIFAAAYFFENKLFNDNICLAKYI